MTIVLIALLCLLAFANGANDNCKGVATLVAIGETTPRKALLWAAATTAVGAAFSFWFGAGLVEAFSKGMLTAGVAPGVTFFIAVLAGAFGWVIVATATGLPVSTTHAITGALVGASLTIFSTDAVRWSILTSKILKPLALSPLCSVIIVYVLARPAVWLYDRVTGRCVCVDAEASPAGAGEMAVLRAAVPRVMTGSEASCDASQPLVKVSGSSIPRVLHWTSSGLVGFARGFNDAPKIAALGVVVLGSAFARSGPAIAFALAATAMTAGGLIAGSRVLQTLAHKVTPMLLPHSLAASFATASLVSLASFLGLPVSTTHVSTGAIVGAGLRTNPRGVHWKKIGEIGLSWLITIPAAGLIAAAASLLLLQIG